jgi:ADP-heptose:LPS heptosyltransferase
LDIKTKILIDKLVGLPLVYLLNVCARILGFILRINHSLDKPFKTIAICKFVGMGSIVQSTPLLKTLRKNYPNAKIIFVTNETHLHLFKYINEVDDIYTIRDKSFFSLFVSNIQLLLKFWKNKPDVYIDLEIYSNYSSVITTMSLSKNRMGFFKDDKSYRKGMYTHMMFFNVKAPVSHAYLQFARMLGCKEIITELTIDTSKINTNIFEKIHQKLEYAFEKKYIVINPNASDLRLERRWPPEKFVHLIKNLSTAYSDYAFILIGDKSEVGYINAIADALTENKNIINSAGKLTLSELIALIANAALLVTNDTGPMHLAFASKTKTVSLFGPCSPQQYGGTENTISIYKNVYCSPCVHDFLIPPCKGDNQCMKKITVDEVQFAIEKMLADSYSDLQKNNTDYTSLENKPLGIVLR